MTKWVLLLAAGWHCFSTLSNYRLTLLLFILYLLFLFIYYLFIYLERLFVCLFMIGTYVTLSLCFRNHDMLLKAHNVSWSVVVTLTNCIFYVNFWRTKTLFYTKHTANHSASLHQTIACTLKHDGSKHESCHNLSDETMSASTKSVSRLNDTHYHQCVSTSRKYDN